MNVTQLCTLINLPEEVSLQVKQYFRDRTSVIDAALKARLLDCNAWGEAIGELQRRIGTDERGFYILGELLNLACDTHEKYRAQGIPDDIFIRTMEFCTRFIERHKQLYGHYAFTWAWWLPRQISMQEFRIEELEFEFADTPERQIGFHIPADADLRPARVQATIKAFCEFLDRHYPDWAGVDWYCDSWMLSPALDGLLDKGSNILYFKQLFEIVSADMQSMAVLDWVFAGQTDLNKLPETTSLQKRMKAFLLGGGKVGWVKGKFKKENLQV